MRSGFDTYERNLLRNPGSLKLAQAGNPERRAPWYPGRAFMNYNTRGTFVRGLAYAASFKLAEAGQSDGDLTTSCEVTLEKGDGGWTVTKSALSTKGKVPGMDQATFEALAAEAKVGCPISRLLDTEITLETAFEG